MSPATLPSADSTSSRRAASGQLQQLLRSGARFAAKAMVQEGAAGAVECAGWTPAGTEVAIPRDLCADILRLIAELRSPLIQRL